MVEGEVMTFCEACIQLHLLADDSEFDEALIEVSQSLVCHNLYLLQLWINHKVKIHRCMGCTIHALL